MSSIATNHFTLEKIEVWAIGGKVKDVKTSLNFKQKVQHSLSILSNESCKHPWVKKMSPYNLFRARPVFMAPSHLTIEELSKIMLSQSVSLTIPSCQALDNNDLQKKTI